MSIDVEDWANPTRDTKPKSENEADRSNRDTDDSSYTSRSNRDRKKRITVTPSNHEELAAAAEKLGLTKAGVYNLAFKRLLDSLDLEV